jgi:hypothetical protein
MDFMLRRNRLPARLNLRRQIVQGALLRVAFLGILATLLGGAAHAQIGPGTPAITSFTVNPTSIDGGQTVTGTVTLNVISNLPITLTSSDSTAAAVPATVFAAANSTTATFTVTTSAVTSDTTVVLAATCNGNTATTNLTVLAPLNLPGPALSALTLNPSSVLAQFSSTGTVTLAGPAPVGGLRISLASFNPFVATVPNSVTVAAGATAATFTITTRSAAATTPVTIRASRGTVTKSALLVVVHNPAFDFNGDGFNDLVFQNSQSGQVVALGLNGLTATQVDNIDTVPIAGYTVVGSADFNNDGQPDLIFQNAVTGKVAIWYLAGTNMVGGGELSVAPGLAYKVVGTGDFNGDGKTDVVFQNQDTHAIVVWFLNGTTVTGGALLPVVPTAGFNLVGVGDFNKDVHPDLVFQDESTGQIVVWYLQGPNSIYIGGGVISGTPGPGWKVKGVADYDNNGYPDLVFQNSASNQVVIWFLNGLTYTGGGFISQQPSAPYLLVGPH